MPVTTGMKGDQAYAAQARDDLVQFYTAGAEEMIPGGKLLVASFGAGERFWACDGLYDVLNDALLDLLTSGRLRRKSYEQLVLPIYFRTVEELVEPVAGGNTDVVKLFTIDKADSMDVPVPFNQRLEQTGDGRAYAREFTDFMRAFTEPIIRMTFVNEPQLDSLIVELYSKVESRLAADPSGYAFHFIQVAALLTRR